MPEAEPTNVTMRVRVGDSEIEVTGPADFVERKIHEFLSNQPRISSPHALEDSALKLQDARGAESGKGLSVAQFFKKVGAKTDMDRALAAGYYLEKYQRSEKFTTAELAEVIKTGAKVAPPKNPSDVVAKNVRKGLMMNAGDKDGKTAFVLTSDGEEAIANMLQS